LIDGLSLVVTALEKLVDESWVGWRPTEVGSSLGGIGALVEQKDFGEVVAQACPSLVIGAGDCSRSTDGRRCL
jgi:hypothetical protein